MFILMNSPNNAFPSSPPSPFVFPRSVFPSCPPIIACGGDIKNIFSLTENNALFPGPPVGDLGNAESFYSFKESIEQYKKRLGVKPGIVVVDKHPGYLSSCYGRELGLPVIEVQHHHAHIASVMAEYALTDKVIGLALDGTGYGDDGTIWGGEILLVTYTQLTRAGYFSPLLLPGGDAAVKEPWRTAVGILYSLFGENIFDAHPGFVEKIGMKRIRHIMSMIKVGINCPLSSGAGRLFDAAASILDVQHENTFEGQAPIKLEEIADPSQSQVLGYSIEKNGEINFVPMIKQLIKGFVGKEDKRCLSAMFHNTVAAALSESCKRLRQETRNVVLSGGVFQNRFLLNRLIPLLKKNDFKVFLPRQIPINDGGLCVGQTAVAISKTLDG